MAKTKPVNVKTLDEMLKAMLVFTRTVDNVLESRAVGAAVKERLSGSRVQILRLLARKGPQTSTAVARYLGVSKPAVTQIVDSMMRSKLLARRTPKTDRREVQHLMTKRGETVAASIRKSQHGYTRNALKKCSGREVNSWIEILNKLSASLAQTDKSLKHFCAQCSAFSDDSCVLECDGCECQYQQHTRKMAWRHGKPGAKKG